MAIGGTACFKQAAATVEKNVKKSAQLLALRAVARPRTSVYLL
jgi:hypothetical protein